MPSSSPRSKQLLLDELPSNHSNPALRRPLAQCSAAGGPASGRPADRRPAGVIYEPLRDASASAAMPPSTTCCSRPAAEREPWRSDVAWSNFRSELPPRIAQLGIRSFRFLPPSGLRRERPTSAAVHPTAYMQRRGAMPRGWRPTITDHRSAAVADGLRGRSVAGPPNALPRCKIRARMGARKISLYLNKTRPRSIVTRY